MSPLPPQPTPTKSGCSILPIPDAKKTPTSSQKRFMVSFWTAPAFFNSKTLKTRPDRRSCRDMHRYYHPLQGQRQPIPVDRLVDGNRSGGEPERCFECGSPHIDWTRDGAGYLASYPARCRALAGVKLPWENGRRNPLGFNI
ncbi:hypothetical protein CIRG_00395 [Coccidioides immitis RMSCC 2394]|uniref:Uncharacterized protein n=1 Tax=Coccidioides immitis RMSCC 2394 TaxID=404692 RepID=A0A0J6Y105_COCIT|nr:hypothetical protein CIRG_00395 [Coccidioides immitis RMSCC 2394]